MPGGQSVGAIYVDAILNNSAFKKQVNSTVKGAESAFSSSFKKVGAAIGAALSVAAVTAFGKSCVQAAMQAESAFMGLESILSSQGKSFSQAEKFLQEYTKDGLIPLTAAANAYKTFASAGFDTKQIEDMMSATKDMATYGRQSHYDMGGALEAFAQGVKNEESALTDAAGMTTNLSVIYEQYAATIGKTAATLSEAEKNQAIYTATMQEWTAVSGDAAKMSNTFQGRLAALKSTLSSIKTEIGNVIIPILDLFMPALQAAANAVLKFVQRIKELLAVFGLEMKTIGGDSGAAAIADGYSAAAGSAGAAADAIKGTGDAAKSAAKAVKRALAPYDELNKLTFGGSASGSSGGGSGGSGDGASTGGDVTASVTKKETGVDSAVSGMSESLKKFIEPLKNISFDNLINAFKSLKDSAAALGGTIWDGLEWAYFNLLVPLAEWTIEDLLPAFLYALEGALDAVDGIIEEVKPSLQWLWDNFLEPVAKWTGGAIVEGLYAIGDALKWVGENADVVMGVAAGVASAFATFKGLTIAASVIEFIKNIVKIPASSGTALATIGEAGEKASKSWGGFSAVFAAVLAKIKETKIWTAVSGAIGKVTGAFGTLATALGISNGALVAIIAVVAAVGAAAYFLITDWEGTIEWFKSWPEKIKGFFDGAVEKISSIDWAEIGKNLAIKLVEGFGKLTVFFEDLPGNLWNAFLTAFDWAGKIGIWAADVVYYCIEGMKNGFLAIGDAVKAFFSGFVDGVKEALGINSPSTVFAEIGGYCIAGLKNGLLNGKTLLSNAWKTVKGWFGGDNNNDIVKNVKVKVATKWNDIKNAWNGIVNNIKDKTANMKAKVGTMWNNIKGAWDSTTKNIKDKTASMKAKVGTTWASIKGQWNSLINNFKDKTVTVTLKVKSIISDMKAWVNSNVIKKINKYVPFVNIPYLAQGGWLPAGSPRLAVVGDNRREGEIVAPESKIREQVKQAITEMNGGGIGGTLRLEIAMPDGRLLIKEINRAQMAAGKVLLIN